MNENKKTQVGNLLTALNDAARLSRHKVFILADGVPDLARYSKNRLIRRLLKAFGLVIHHFKLGTKISKNRASDLVLLYGFSTEFLFVSYITSWFYTRNVYLLVHHNIQQASQNVVMKFFMKAYHYLGYKFVIHETTSVLKYLDFNEQEIAKHVVLLHPVRKLDLSPDRQLKLSSTSLDIDNVKSPKIGIIGSIRRGKRFSETLALLLDLGEKLEFQLVVGANNLSELGDINLNGAALIDTSESENYLAAIEFCDIVILNYEKSQYLFRCSGVAADAIGTKTYVVCPNYPLMSHQLRYPDEVGLLYDEESELEMVLEKALSLVLSSSNDEIFEKHYAERSAEKMASLFDSLISERESSLTS